MGNTRPNEEEGPDSDSDKPADSGWKKLLNEDNGAYSLKPWADVLKIGVNKITIGDAFREFMRQTWSECCLTVNVHFLNLILLYRKIRQKGEDPLE